MGSLLTAMVFSLASFSLVCLESVIIWCLSSLRRAGIDDVETDVVEIEAKLDKVRPHARLESTIKSGFFYPSVMFLEKNRCCMSIHLLLVYNSSILVTTDGSVLII